ncbi:hypothetical protein KSP39_PZI003286 [Platanthera zijinensis]|uniref:Uncharacterized protein n=1 Tax=Platanthera zijinensis TaxID=2320716 RepID=A0AAP0GCH5_9ASPA
MAAHSPPQSIQTDIGALRTTGTLPWQLQRMIDRSTGSVVSISDGRITCHAHSSSWIIHSGKTRHITLTQPSYYLDSVHPKFIIVANGDTTSVSGSADITLTLSIILCSVLHKGYVCFSLKDLKLVTSPDVTFLEDRPYHSQPTDSPILPLLLRPSILITTNLSPLLPTPLPLNPHSSHTTPRKITPDSCVYSSSSFLCYSMGDALY